MLLKVGYHLPSDDVAIYTLATIGQGRVIELLQGIVDDGSKCAIVHKVSRITVLTQVLNMMQVKPERAVDRLGYRAVRQALRMNRIKTGAGVNIVVYGHMSLVNDDGRHPGRRDLSVNPKLGKMYLIAIEQLQLSDESRCLSPTLISR